MPKKITDLGNNRYCLRVRIGVNEKGNVITRSDTVTCPNGAYEAGIAYAKFEEKVKKEEAQKARKAASKKFTVHDLLIKYYEEHTIVNSSSPTSLSYDRNMSKRIDEALGHIPIDRFNISHANKFVAALTLDTNRHTGKPLAKSTIRKYALFLSQVFNKAVEWNLLDKNPCKGMSKPSKEQAESEKIIPTNDEMVRLLSAIEEESIFIQAIFWIIVETGMRRGEVLGLKWQNIDLETGELGVVNNLVKGSMNKADDKKTTNKGPKSRAGKRDLDVSGKIRDLLLRIRNDFLSIRETLLIKCHENRDILDFIFINYETCDHFYPDSVTEFIGRVSKKAGVRRFTPHNYRHWFCSSCIDAGDSIKVVQTAMGHAKASTTLDVYTHIKGKRKHSTALTISSVLKQLNDDASGN